MCAGAGMADAAGATPELSRESYLRKKGNPFQT